MKMRFLAAIAFAMAASCGTSTAAEYAVITIERPVNAPADMAWKKISPYCLLIELLGTTCQITKGDGVQIGSVRSVSNGRVSEIMVSKSATGYTYTFAPPNPTSYHGTMETVATGAKTSKIVYTLFYDEEPLGTPEAKAKDRESRTKMFTGAVEKLVGIAEAK